MSKVGYISILIGFLTITCYSIYILLDNMDVSIIIKIGIVLIFSGIVLIIFKQILDKKKEKDENDDYKNY